MICYQDSQCKKFENKSLNSFIFVNSNNIKGHKEVCKAISSKRNNFVFKNK